MYRRRFTKRRCKTHESAKARAENSPNYPNRLSAIGGLSLPCYLLPPGDEIPPRELIFEPEIFVYIKDFGGKDDCGAVAELGGKIVGAAWTRIIPGYGNIDDKTPELAISVLPEHRGHGIGAALMEQLFELLRERGYSRTSLSVQQNNPAVRFYQRLGYIITDEKTDHAGH